jgi:predicted outer membrane repeat protein
MPKETKASAASCQNLPQNSSRALKDIIEGANGERVHLCDATIIFEQEVALAVPIDLVCESRCVFDGNHSQRLFSFDFNVSPQLSTLSLDVSFQNVVFQNGLAVPSKHGIPGGGGAIQIFGYSNTSVASFKNCQFLHNSATYDESGGAIDISGGKMLELINCTFENNTAFSGGAISTTGVPLNIESSKFVKNSVCGLAEGAAIFSDSLVECVDGNNFFVDNQDATCIAANPNYSFTFDYDIVGPTVQCGNVAAP